VKKTIQNLCGLPGIGGFIAFLFGFILPVMPGILLASTFGWPKPVGALIAGICVVAWDYFLRKTGTVNIVTPLLPFPIGLLGVLMALFAIFKLIFG